ncbi:MAG: D-alanyl-D-alanine carboxypeptidase/D-alanyl-D-alanine-endopeptidase [Lentisphaeraceae bacterium]|nr:D-alanyl-D-alanine carboxypeptidase/D-alanyl-D-alanine-endopeptidase [Lentisphaeraceae bacterium]
MFQQKFETAFSGLFSKSKISFYLEENGFKKSSYQENDLLIPASNTKLFITAAALLADRPQEVQPPLKIYYTGTLSNNVLSGDLYLDSCGSLVFSGRYPASLSIEAKLTKLTKQLDNFAQKLQQKGIKTVQGDLKLSFERWSGIEDNPHYNAAVPFSFNENTVDVEVKANKLLTVPEKPQIFKFSKDSSIDAQSKKEGNVIHYNPQNDSKDYWRINKIDVNEYAKSMLKRELEKRGIIFQNASTAFKDKTLLFDQEPCENLKDFIHPINQYSDNFRAEVLALQLACLISKEATYEGVTPALKEIFKDAQLGEYKFEDGSGLSRQNQVSSKTIVKLLRLMKKSAFHRPFEKSLSVAGKSGTLAKRFRGTVFEGRLIGKTGTLNGVSALSGYWRKDEFTSVCFSFIGNGATNEEFWEGLESFAKSLG